MNGIRVLIVDDERLARVGLRRELAAMDGVEVVGECAGGAEAVEAIRDLAPDVVLLDVRMPGMDGFDVVREIGPDAMPPVIFVTAHDEHALRAFEVNAVDYVLKPVEPERFRTAFRRAAERLGKAGAEELRDQLGRILRRIDALEDRTPEEETPEEGASEEGGGRARPGRLDRLAVEKAGRVTFVEVDEIRRIESAGNYVRLHTGSGTYLARRTLKSLERDLDPGNFLRVRRSTIVNMERVAQLEPGEDGRWEIRLDDGTTLRASRRRRGAVSDYVERHS